MPQRWWWSAMVMTNFADRMELWAEQILLDALKADDDVAHRMRSGLKFNPVATAFAGIAELYRRGPDGARLRTLLDIATRESPAGAHGFAAAAVRLAEIDERIPKAIVRCGLAACVSRSANGT